MVRGTLSLTPMKAIKNLAIQLLICILLTSCSNQKANNELNQFAAQELSFLDEKVRTFLRSFMNDAAASQLKPSIYSKNLQVFDSYYFQIFPIEVIAPEVVLTRDSTVEKLQRLNTELQKFEIDQDLKNEFEQLLTDINLKASSNPILYIRFEQFELSLLIDLHQSQSCYKLQYLEECIDYVTS